jgi:hypothetical protein
MRRRAFSRLTWFGPSPSSMRRQPGERHMAAGRLDQQVPAGRRRSRARLGQAHDQVEAARLPSIICVMRSPSIICSSERSSAPGATP